MVKLLPANLEKENKMFVLVGLEMLIFITFLVFNFKASKFTIGEKLTNIQKHYHKQ
jgi:hypothetical protein